MKPIAVGVLLALASALAFGLTIPLLGWAGAGVGAYGTAALLFQTAAEFCVPVGAARVPCGSRERATTSRAPCREVGCATSCRRHPSSP